jgi:hypothetical protein
MATTYTEVRAKGRAEAILESLRQHSPALWKRLGPRDVLRLSVEGESLLAERLEAAEQRAGDLERRLVALERRLESEKRGFPYEGIWTEGESYAKGCFVTHQGGLWHAWEDTAERPGTSDVWQLCVKAGRR